MAAASDIASAEHRHLLDTIDRLRAQGINRHVALPQIVVTGDQSAGKSSVLEAISGLSFPAKDTLCTRFATELSLRRSPQTGVRASIFPGRKCRESRKKQLANFCPKIEEGSLNLSLIVELAKEAMGIGTQLKNFSDDILRIEVSGPQQPHLTMVDLPGLFQAGNSAQTDDDSEAVEKMVLKYISQPRSIILAVVSAKSDFSLQKVTRLAREYDPDGLRTLGLITKPDTLDEGSESETAYIQLAQNEDVQLHLGWHVLKNRDYQMVTNNASTEERDESEAAFFSKGAWGTLDPRNVGVAALRARLSDVLRHQIVTHLPDLIDDIEQGIDKCKGKLQKLGEARENIAAKRLYLLGISQRFSELMKAAIDGNYNDGFFLSSKSEEGFERRLRAVVQSLLTQFKDEMHESGCNKRLVELTGDEITTDVCLQENEMFRSTYVEEVRGLINRNRGCELPGTFNPLIVGELFTEQCKPWETITKTLASNLLEAVNNLIHVTMHYVAIEETADKLESKISDSVRQLEEELTASFAHLLKPHQTLHPITYNHALTGHVRDAQAERRRRNALARVKGLYSSDYELRITRSELLEILTTDPDTEIKTYGSALAVDYMEAYYNVTLEKYIDDISTLGVECSLIQKLRTVFEPSHIYSMQEDEVSDLAAESPVATQERAKLKDKLDLHYRARSELRKLTKYRPQPKRSRNSRRQASLFVSQESS